MNKKEWKKLGAGLAFIAPNYIGFIFFTLIPMTAAILLSFYKGSMQSGISNLEFAGLAHFFRLWKDEWFINSMKNTMIFALFTVPVTMVLAFTLAFLLDTFAFAKNIIRSMFFLPYVVNIVAVCYVWMMMFQPTYGPINEYLRRIMSSPPGWLSQSAWALICIMIMQIWINLGYCMVIYLAGLKQIPLELLEAAKIDGAGLFQQVRYVIIPRLSPTTFFILITMLINALKIFAPVNIMTDGGPGSSSTVLVFYAYISAFRFYDMGYASAISTVLFMMIFIITYFQWKGQKLWVDY
jgi:multiple sugar transport system permease protein